MSVEISVIIPSRDAVHTLAATLSSLGRSTFAHGRFEILVIDDGSTDGTPGVIEAFRASADIRVVTMRNEKPLGAGAARNLGIREAQGTILAFTDADCVPDTDWLETIFDTFAQDASAVLLLGDTWCDEVVLFPWKMSPAGQTGITANMAYHRGRGGEQAFDPAFSGIYGEDTDFVRRVAARGLAVKGSTAMRVEHPVRRMSLRAVLRRAWLRKNEVRLVARYGSDVASSFHPLFRPRLFDRVSLATVAVFAGVAVLVSVVLLPVLLIPSVFLVLAAAIGFLTFGYQACIMYAPSMPAMVPLGERAKTLVAIVLYLPVFVASHVAGSLESRHFLL